MTINKIPISSIKNVPDGIAGIDSDGFVSAFSADSVNVRRFGAVGDGIADDTQPIKTAISQGGRIYFPPGIYRVTETLNIKKPILMEGPSGTQQTEGVSYPAVLRFSSGIVGVFVHRKNTNASNAGVPVIETATTGGDGTIIQNLSIQAGNGNDPTPDGASHGVWVKARCVIRDVFVAGFAGNGINVVATAGSGVADTEGNANLFRISGVRVINNGGHGYYCNGADANAGLVELLDCSSNAGWGFYDSSFLGNTYVGCHVDSNVVGSYKTDNPNARNVLIGCYSESGWPASDLVAPTVVVGGLHGAGFTPETTAFRVFGSTAFGQLSPYQIEAHPESTNNFIASYCRAADEALTISAVGDGGGGLSPLTWDNATGCWVTRHRRLGARTPVRYTTDLNTLSAGRSSALGGGQVLFAQGHWLGSSTTNLRHVTNGTAAPTTGEWARGDRVYNVNPTAGGFAGWICTASGTPGTWKGFGAIEP